MNPFEFLGPAIAVLGGLLVLRWGFACRAERFPRNLLLGYRTRAALRDELAWNAAHRGLAPSLIVAGAALALAGSIALLAVLAGMEKAVAPVLGIGIILLIAGLVTGGVFAHRSLSRHLDQNG